MIKLPSGKTYLDPAYLLEKLELGPNMRVGSFGCGGEGFLTLQAAELVKPHGRVFAVDILKPNLSAIWSKAKLSGLDHIIRCVWSDLEIHGAAKKIKDESLDRGILANVLHQSKKQKDILKECGRTLKNEGRLLVVEWKSAGLVFGPQEKFLVDKDRAIQLAAACGLALMDEFRAGAYHYGLVFTKIS